MRYLLDTCTASGLLLPDVHRKLRIRFDMRRLQCTLASFVVAELRYGALIVPGERGRELVRRTEALTDELAILPFDGKAARWFAEERARLKPTGETVALEDLMIAATAAVNDLVLVTHNVRHFRPVNVAVEDWAK